MVLRADETERGLFAYFFGKRRKVARLATPFSYKAKAPVITDDARRPGSSPYTYLTFVTQCGVDAIFDKKTKECVERRSEKGQDVAMKRYRKYVRRQLDGDQIKGLVQFRDNCWFNSLLMCLFFSDGGRRLMNQLRPGWIKNNVRSRSALYNVFTYMMEMPHYNTDIINTIDSNMILSMLHAYDANIFEHPGYEGGSGILYSKKLLEFLGMREGYHEFRFFSINNMIYVEKDGNPDAYLESETQIQGYISDNIRRFSRVDMVAVFLNIRPLFPMPLKLLDMTLDSLYLANYNKASFSHAISGITCGGKRYVYDGQRAALYDTLKPFDWHLPKKHSFVMSYDRKGELRFDFGRSNRVAFYVANR